MPDVSDRELAEMFAYKFAPGKHQLILAFEQAILRGRERERQRLADEIGDILQASTQYVLASTTAPES